MGSTLSAQGPEIIEIVCECSQLEQQKSASRNAVDDHSEWPHKGSTQGPAVLPIPFRKPEGDRVLRHECENQGVVSAFQFGKLGEARVGE